MDTDQDLEEFLRLHGRNWNNPQDLCVSNTQDQAVKLVEGKMNLADFKHNNLESKVGSEITKAHPNEEVGPRISPSFSQELVASGYVVHFD